VTTRSWRVHASLRPPGRQACDASVAHGPARIWAADICGHAGYVQRDDPYERGYDVDGSDADIYRKHREDLVRYATSLVGPDDAADVVSTVVTKVLARGGLKELVEPKQYLMKAVLNESRSVHRARSRRLIDDDALGFVEDPVPDDVVFSAVMSLPVRQRAATYLVYWGGYSPSEAADLMGCRAGTVRRYLHLARRKLKGVISDT
jgi:RNA polymerase sigma factor (sigma-70 family)